MDLKYIYEHNKALYEQQYKEPIFCKEFLKIQDIEGGLVLPIGQVRDIFLEKEEF